MSHYAVVAPPLYSHWQALQALAQALIKRGHQVTFIHQAEASSLLSDPRIAFQAVGQDSHPPGSLAHTLKLAASPAGFSLFALIKDMSRATDMLCRELPKVLKELRVDGLIVDQMEAAGGLVAEGLGLPFVSVACALPVNREQGIPLPVMSFGYGTDHRAQKLFRTSQRIYDWMMRGHGRVIARHAERFGLSARTGLHECLSPLAQISQTVPALDFPRRALPAHFYQVGPLRPSVTEQRFWPLISSRPFVFASLGTLQGHRFRLFKTIARACRRLHVQLLIAHCGGLSAKQAAQLEACGAYWVTDFADQPSVLQQAQAVITHGGLNTVADAVSSSTPILAVPIAFDQPGVASRVVWNGLGRRVSRFASSKTMAKNLAALLRDDCYRTKMTEAQHQLSQAGGAQKAADIVEQAIASHSTRIKATG
ncbi:glycosyltransferase [Kalamiella sp. sgz302252]|uniref:glycosyltransferase n=1 Tax=Pantoea sp. sgz302252 TaxID=3341827 RepID=UPI0036D25F8B